MCSLFSKSQTLVIYGPNGPIIQAKSFAEDDHDHQRAWMNVLIQLYTLISFNTNCKNESSKIFNKSKNRAFIFYIETEKKERKYRETLLQSSFAVFFLETSRNCKHFLKKMSRISYLKSCVMKRFPLIISATDEC